MDNTLGVRDVSHVHVLSSDPIVYFPFHRHIQNVRDIAL